MDLANQIRDFLNPKAENAETARTNRTNNPPEAPAANSTICARDSAPSQTHDPRSQWTEDALFVYDERLAIADDLGLDTSPGSPAERTALREARRVMAGLPLACTASRERETVDAALAAFPGVRFVGFIDASEVAPVWPELNARSSPPPPSNPAHAGLEQPRVPTPPEATR